MFTRSFFPGPMFPPSYFPGGVAAPAPPAPTPAPSTSGSAPASSEPWWWRPRRLPSQRPAPDPVVGVGGVTASAALQADTAGLGTALAGSMAAFAAAVTPIVGAVIGEARGEAAVALGIADRLLMLQNAAFEVVSPEAAASILYRDTGMADSVAPALRPTARDCLKLHIVDSVVPEPAAGAHADHDAAARLLSAALLRAIGELKGTSPRKLVRSRYDRYRRMGQYTNFIRETVSRDVAQLGGEIARRATGAISRLTRRSAREPHAAPGAGDDGESLLVP